MSLKAVPSPIGSCFRFFVALNVTYGITSSNSFLIYNNILARFTPLSFVYVETGIEWGFSVFDDLYGEDDDIYNNFFHIALPLGYGFRIANRFEIGERFYFGLDRYASHLGSMIRYQIVYVSVLF